MAYAVTQELLNRSFSFSVQLVELTKYLKDENKLFPLEERLLNCGNGIAVNLRLAEMSDGKEWPAAANQTLACAVESAHLLKLLAKTGYLTEQQSLPLREECGYLIDLITNEKKKYRSR